MHVRCSAQGAIPALLFFAVSRVSKKMGEGQRVRRIWNLDRRKVRERWANGTKRWDGAKMGELLTPYGTIFFYWAPVHGGEICFGETGCFLTILGTHADEISSTVSNTNNVNTNEYVLRSNRRLRSIASFLSIKTSQKGRVPVIVNDRQQTNINHSQIHGRRLNRCGVLIPNGQMLWFYTGYHMLCNFK